MNVLGEQVIEFEYTWKLQNHNLLHPFHYASVKSPEFETPTSPQIKWCLGYFPKFSFDNLSVFLQRSDKDDGSLATDVVYNLSIVNENGAVNGISETSRITFHRGDSKICVISLTEAKQLHDSKVFTLRCNFFTTNEPIGIELQEDTRILSKDIRSLLENEVMCDVILKQPDCDFKAHKCILWARCPEILKLQNSQEELVNSGSFRIQPNELKSLLNDVYSGRLDTFKSDAPLISAVRKYELILQGKKSLSSLCVYSNVQKHSISQICSFNILQLSSEKKIYTPLLTLNGNEFKLVVQLTNQCGDEKVVSCLRCVSTETSDPIYLHYEIKLLGAKGDCHISSSHLFSSGEDYIIPWELNASILRASECKSQSNVNFFCVSVPQQSIKNYSDFDLECILSISDGSVQCTSELWKSKPLNYEIDYKILSNDLLNLYKSRKFSDVTLAVGKKEISAHKSILSARSPVFCRMFQTNMAECLNNVVTITDIQFESMESLLEYIYTGRVKLQNIDNIMQLYTAADKYEVLNLKQNCASYLESKINNENVNEILILADMHQDIKLKQSAQTFIYENAEKILVSDGWKNMIEERIDLAVEIIHQLSLEYAEKKSIMKHTNSEACSKNISSIFGPPPEPNSFSFVQYDSVFHGKCK